MANDYKQDAGKVPLLAALQPFMPALYALARMMDDMQHKHRLAGSVDPFNQWAQLPNAKPRMSGALIRHLLPDEEGATLWSVNTKDGNHLHATHGLFNLLGALTLHLRDNADRCCGAPDAVEASGAPARDPLADRAAAELRLQGEHQASPLHGPAGADWRDDKGMGPARCLSVSDRGTRCQREEGHYGVHTHKAEAWRR